MTDSDCCREEEWDMSKERRKHSPAFKAEVQGQGGSGGDEG